MYIKSLQWVVQTKKLTDKTVKEKTETDSELRGMLGTR